MSFIRGDCTPACSRDGGSLCWHKNSIIRRQLLSGKWMLENIKGYIRLADEYMIVFDEDEYINNKNPNANNGDHTINSILKLMEKYNYGR